MPYGKSLAEMDIGATSDGLLVAAVTAIVHFHRPGYRSAYVARRALGWRRNGFMATGACGRSLQAPGRPGAGHASTGNGKRWWTSSRDRSYGDHHSLRLRGGSEQSDESVYGLGCVTGPGSASTVEIRFWSDFPHKQSQGVPTDARGLLWYHGVVALEAWHPCGCGSVEATR